MAKAKTKEPELQQTSREYLGAQIRARRKAKGWSTYTLSKAIGKPQPRIPAIEQGRVKDIDIYETCLQVLGGMLQVRWLD